MLAPTLVDVQFDAHVIQYALHQAIGEFDEVFGVRVETGRRRENHRAGTPQRQHVAKMDFGQRRFANRKNEATILLQEHITGA